ncbi:MAG: hypothetical protein JST84_18295 [Acidobacteria bacterium]|nr:hypothetical protein [Acidobacteriota bacterium]
MITILGIIVWALAVGIGFAYLTDYGTRPNQLAHAPPHLPVDILGMPPNKLPTLLLFAHPHCPCTHATMAELARLIAHNRGQVNVHVLFYRPLEKPREWAEADLWQKAKKLPDVTVSTVSELDLLRFGVSTSGQTLVYDANQKLVFSGGITSARGHEGDNTGRAAITTYLQTGQLTTQQTPVFGCSITEDQD